MEPLVLFIGYITPVSSSLYMVGKGFQCSSLSRTERVLFAIGGLGGQGLRLPSPTGFSHILVFILGLQTPFILLLDQHKNNPA